MRSNDPHDNGVVPLRGELYPRCAGCGYRLEGLPEPRCPECGRPFDFRDPGSYEFAPPLRLLVYWTPGLLLAGAVAAVAAGLYLLTGSLAFALGIGVPAAAGGVLAYGTRATLGCGFLIAVPGLCGFAGLAIDEGSDSLIAGGFLGLLLTLPAALGLMLGLVLRGRMKRSAFSQRWHLP